MTFRLIATLLAVALGSSACTPAPTPSAVPSPAVKPAPVQPKAAVAYPDQSNTFADIDACVKAGFLRTQCDRAQGTALSMHVVAAPLFKDARSCLAYFTMCIGQHGQYAPQMTAFSMGNETKGVFQPVSVKNPITPSPVYTNQAKMGVYLLADQHNAVHAVPLGAAPGSKAWVAAPVVGKVPSEAERKSAFKLLSTRPKNLQPVKQASPATAPAR